MSNQGKIARGLFWKLLENFGVQGVQFLVQIFLARILDVELYGVLAIMVVFTSLANVFIQKGFSTALVQNKDVTEEDYSSVFWVTLTGATLIYGFLFFTAPLIASYYKMPAIVLPFRVLCLMIFPGALNSIQMGMINRRMDFKKAFYSNVVAILCSGAVGIILALAGAGLWALVGQTLINVCTSCLVMWFTVKWRPRMVCNWTRVKVLFSYGWKLLAAGLLDTAYSELNSLIIGRKYNSETLAYSHRGRQFPQFFINSINSAVHSVLLPAMSAEQDSKMQVKYLMRNSIMISSFVIFPCMAGLAAVSEPLVTLLLTEKWLLCVPYLQIACFTFAFYPVHTSNLQAINAMGRSDIFLKLEIIKKACGLVALAISVFCFDSPIAIAWSGIVTTLISCFVNAWPNKALIGYSYMEQIKDILPSLVISLVMCGCVLMLNLLGLSPILTLLIQIPTGVAIYVLLSYVFKLTPFKLVLNILAGMRKRGAHQ